MTIQDDLARIESDWQSVERLLDAMGLKDFLRVVAQIGKDDGKLGRWLRQVTSGWHSVRDDPPPMDGTHVMFGRALPWSSSGNVAIGFWHVGQNVPGWQEVSTLSRIDTDVMAYWRHLPNAPTP